MLSKSKAIVLSTLRYKENDLIVKCYTNERGLVSYLQKGVFKSKRSKTKAVLINSPNNPTGKIYSEEEITALSQMLKDKKNPK